MKKYLMVGLAIALFILVVVSVIFLLEYTLILPQFAVYL